MLSKNYTAAAFVLLVCTASANNQKTYIVHKGDTIGTISKQFNVPTSELVSENSLEHKHLRAGMKLTIPTTHTNSASYKVVAGDNDWVLAHRLGTTIAELKKLNPDTDWRHLQIGSSIKVPGKASASAPKFKSRYAEVATDHATIRRSPSKDADKVTLVDAGTRVTVLNYQDGWYQLRFPKGTVGWMRGDLLKAAPAPAVVAAVAKPKKVVAAKPAVVAAARPKPAIVNAPVVAQTASLTVTTPTATKTEPAPAAKVEPKVEAKPEVKVARSGPTDEELLNKAYHLRGTRYRYGSLNPSRGLDCSGFTTNVFKAAGIQLPRTSRSQSTIGVHVSRGQLEPGDLVFFRTGRSSRINHVGMYVGNGKFIHAASGYGAVRVDNLNGHYSHELATARRIPAIRHVVEGEEVEKPAPAKKEPVAAKAQAPAKPVVKPDPPELPAPSPAAKKPADPKKDVH